MKKILLTTIALLSMASASVFGMYGVDTDWIFFLTHGNQFRARMDQLGFTLGNDMIKGTFGFDNNNSFGGIYGNMLNSVEAGTTAQGEAVGNGFFYNFVPTISMGLGYTSSLISVGVGYNITIGNDRWVKYDGNSGGQTAVDVAHTPVLVLNALDNAFRMAIPIQIVDRSDKLVNGKYSYTAVSVDSQFRYYTGMDFLPQIRLYLRYGYYGYNTESGGQSTKGKYAETFGFDFRLYFGTTIEEVLVQPIVRLVYNGALGKQHNQTRIQAVNLLNNISTGGNGYQTMWEKSPWELAIIPALGLTANSDIVSLYFEPSLGLAINQAGSATDKNVKEVYGLAYDVYAEIYITPIKNLEWYFEASIGNIGSGTPATRGLVFAGTTGITWYLPAL